MSYSKVDARAEFEGRVDFVLEHRDVEGARELAEMLAYMGDDEEAEKFHKLSHKWQDEDDAHDRNNNN